MRKAIFFNPVIAGRVARDYGAPPGTVGDELKDAVASKFQPLLPSMGAGAASPDDEVFTAAALALASNSRNWSKVIAKLEDLKSALLKFDPVAVASVADAPTEREALLARLTAILGGQTARQDSKSIIRFAQFLRSTPEYGHLLNEAREELRERDSRLSDTKLTAAVSLLLAKGDKALRSSPDVSATKIFGMGPALASEFLRNLGWQSFKPDRHVIRLLRAWMPQDARDAVTNGYPPDVLFKGLSKEERDFWKYAIIGEAVTPKGESVNDADQLLWMMGAYVIRPKRKQRAGVKKPLPSEAQLVGLMAQFYSAGLDQAITETAKILAANWGYHEDAAHYEARTVADSISARWTVLIPSPR